VGSVTSFYLERANFNALFGQDRLNVQFAKRKAVTAETCDELGRGCDARRRSEGEECRDCRPDRRVHAEQCAVHEFGF